MKNIKTNYTLGFSGNVATITKTSKYSLRQGKYLQIGSSVNGVVGFCLFDKLCWTNVFGFEILNRKK